MANTNKGRKFPAEPLTEDEVRSLIRACSNRAPSGIRNRALLAVLYRCGLRCAEALSLSPKDVDAKTNQLRVLCGKGGKSRTVGIDDDALAVLDRWLDTRKRLGITSKVKPLFCTITASKDKSLKPGAAMKTDYVRQLLPRLKRKAGIERRVHAHAFRHTFVSKQMANGVSVPDIQRQLGHRPIDDTDTYFKSSQRRTT